MNKRVAILGMVLAAALALAACTSGRPHAAEPTAAASKPAAGIGAASGNALPDQTLVFEGQPGYGTRGARVPGSEARFAYAHESSCPDAKLVPRYGLRLQAKWRYQGKVAVLTAVQASFDEKSGSLAIPFMTARLGPAQSPRQWVTSVVEGNSVRGYRSTGWVPLRADFLVTKAAFYPVLTLQLWAVSLLTNTLHCAASTWLYLVPGFAYGDSA